MASGLEGSRGDSDSVYGIGRHDYVGHCEGGSEADEGGSVTSSATREGGMNLGELTSIVDRLGWACLASYRRTVNGRRQEREVEKRKGRTRETDCKGGSSFFEI